MRCLLYGWIAGAAFAAIAGAPPPNSDEVTLNTVKWPELEKAIAVHKGNVLAIDVWADFCIPCKREFHHLVELHQKYTKDGLDCLSVTVDDKDDAAKALTFLRTQKATLNNYLIDETPEVWSKKLNVSGPPAVLVYDRAGKRVKTFTSEDPFTYADVEKLVQSLLKDKR